MTKCLEAVCWLEEVRTRHIHFHTDDLDLLSFGPLALIQFVCHHILSACAAVLLFKVSVDYCVRLFCPNVEWANTSYQCHLLLSMTDSCAALFEYLCASCEVKCLVHWQRSWHRSQSPWVGAAAWVTDTYAYIHTAITWVMQDTLYALKPYSLDNEICLTWSVLVLANKRVVVFVQLSARLRFWLKYTFRVESIRSSKACILLVVVECQYLAGRWFLLAHSILMCAACGLVFHVYSYVGNLFLMNLWNHWRLPVVHAIFEV